MSARAVAILLFRGELLPVQCLAVYGWVTEACSISIITGKLTEEQIMAGIGPGKRAGWGESQQRQHILILPHLPAQILPKAHHIYASQNYGKPLRAWPPTEK